MVSAIVALPVQPGQCCPQYECELGETSTSQPATDLLPDLGVEILYDDHYEGDYSDVLDTTTTRASDLSEEDLISGETEAQTVTIETETETPNSQEAGDEETEEDPDSVAGDRADAGDSELQAAIDLAAEVDIQEHEQFLGARTSCRHTAPRAACLGQTQEHCVIIH